MLQLSITAKRMDKWTIAVRPVEARREDSLPGRGEKKVRVTTREIGRERERKRGRERGQFGRGSLFAT